MSLQTEFLKGAIQGEWVDIHGVAFLMHEVPVLTRLDLDSREHEVIVLSCL